MGVIYLGERRESPLKGYGKAIMDYSKSVREERVEAAKRKAERDEISTTIATKAHENLYKKYGEKPDKLKAYLSLDEGKEAVKFIKRYYPEGFDESGQILMLPAEKEPWEPKTREEQIKFKADSEAALLKVKAGQPLTPTEAGTAANAIDIMIYRKAIDPETGRALLEKIGQSMQNKFSGAMAGEGRRDVLEDELDKIFPGY